MNDTESLFVHACKILQIDRWQQFVPEISVSNMHICRKINSLLLKLIKAMWVTSAHQDFSS